MNEPRILRKEVFVDAPIAEVWRAWTTVEGLKFVSSNSNVELRVGGPYEWFLDLEADEQGKRGSEGSTVLAYLPERMIAFAWTFPPPIPELRYAGETTQVVVLLEEINEGRVRVALNAHGWQDGKLLRPQQVTQKAAYCA